MIKQLKENKKGLAFTFFRSLFINSRSGNQYALDAKNGFNVPYFNVIQNLFLKISQCQNIINSSFVLFILPFFFIKQRNTDPVSPWTCPVTGKDIGKTPGQTQRPKELNL